MIINTYLASLLEMSPKCFKMATYNVSIIIYPLTARVVGAPKMIWQLISMAGEALAWNGLKYRPSNVVPLLVN